MVSVLEVSELVVVVLVVSVAVVTVAVLVVDVPVFDVSVAVPVVAEVVDETEVEVEEIAVVVMVVNVMVVSNVEVSIVVRTTSHKSPTNPGWHSHVNGRSWFAELGETMASPLPSPPSSSNKSPSPLPTSSRSSSPEPSTAASATLREWTMQGMPFLQGFGLQIESGVAVVIVDAWVVELVVSDGAIVIPGHKPQCIGQ